MDRKQFWLLSGVLLITALAYWPGLSGGFVFDDYPNIVNNPAYQNLAEGEGSLLEVYVSGVTSSLKRPVSLFSFALNVKLTGMDPFAFKLTNLFIHLFNGVLVFLLCRGLLGIAVSRQLIRLPSVSMQWIALAVAAAWLLHPLNLTSVLYVVQRMNSLAALFTLAGLVVYLRSRRAMIDTNAFGWGVWLGLPLFTALAVFSKENGILLIPLALLLELVLFRFATGRQWQRTGLYGLFGLILVLPVLAGLVLLFIDPQSIIGGYGGRDFTLTERLMTQTRAIWFYLYLIVIPNTGLMSLYHDAFGVSTGLLQPVTTLLSTAGLAFLVVLSVLVWRKAPVITFGILFFLIGHSIESTVIPLELIFEHRNYLPGLGILLILFYYLLHPGLSPKTLRIRTAAAALFLCLLAAGTLLRADQWSEPLRFSMIEWSHNPESARTNYELGRNYAILFEATGANNEKLYQAATERFEKAIKLDPKKIIAHVSLIVLTVRNDKTVEDETYQALIDPLANKRLAIASVSGLNGLFQCIIDEQCDIDKTYTDRIIEAVTRNPEIRGRHASMMQVNISKFIWKHYKQRDRAIAHAQKAVEMTPEYIMPRLNLVAMLLLNKQPEYARYEIGEMLKIDPTGYGKSRVEEMGVKFE